MRLMTKAHRSDATSKNGSDAAHLISGLVRLACFLVFQKMVRMFFPTLLRSRFKRVPDKTKI